MIHVRPHFRNQAGSLLLVGVLTTNALALFGQENTYELRAAGEGIGTVQQGVTGVVTGSMRTIYTDSNAANGTCTINMFDAENGERVMTVVKNINGETKTMVFRGDEIDNYEWEADNAQVTTLGDGQRVMVMSNAGAVEQVFTTEDNGQFTMQAQVAGDGTNEPVEIEMDGKNLVVKVTGPDGQVEERVVSLDLDKMIGDAQAGDVEEEVETTTEVSDDGQLMVQTMVIRRTVRIEDVAKDDPLVEDQKPFQAESLSFYPNPNDGRFTVQFAPGNKKPVNVLITDLQGRVVRQEVWNGMEEYQVQMDISNEPTGTYLINLRQGKRAVTKKIVMD